MATFVSENVRTQADTLALLHEKAGHEFPISGDEIAEHRESVRVAERITELLTGGEDG